MALVPCPECDKEVSSKASICPSCGHPIASHLLKQQLKGSIAKATESIKDTARVHCKKCGSNAGVVNLSSGLCEQCRGVQAANISQKNKVYSKQEIYMGLLKFGIILSFMVGMYVFFYSKL